MKCSCCGSEVKQDLYYDSVNRSLIYKGVRLDKIESAEWKVLNALYKKINSSLCRRSFCECVGVNEDTLTIYLCRLRRVLMSTNLNIPYRRDGEISMVELVR